MIIIIVSVAVVLVGVVVLILVRRNKGQRQSNNSNNNNSAENRSNSNNAVDKYKVKDDEEGAKEGTVNAGSVSNNPLKQPDEVEEVYDDHGDNMKVKQEVNKD